MQVASPHQMMVPLSLLVMTHRLSPDALLGTTFGFSKDTWVLGGGGLSEVSRLSLKLTPAAHPLSFIERTLLYTTGGGR